MFIFYLDYSISVLDGKINTVIDLSTDLQCVQGNNPRSISFMIATTSVTNTCQHILTTGNSNDEPYNAFAITLSCGNNNTHMSGLIQVDSMNAAYILPLG
jgi:hypothetical protein